VRTAGRELRDTLGGTLFQFIATYVVWIVAQHLGLSAVLCEIAYAMTLARITDARDIDDTRIRVQSFAVWDSVVFTLNVVAFLLMGMQVHSIVLTTSGHHLHHAFTFAAAVSFAVISIRLFTVLAFTRLERWWKSKSPRTPRVVREGLLCRLVRNERLRYHRDCLRAPSWFPHRDTVVLAAFEVVLVTLVLQGITVAPLLEALKLDQKEQKAREEKEAHIAMAQSSLASLTGLDGPEAENVRYRFSLKLAIRGKDFNEASSERVREVALRALLAERNTLNELLDRDKIDPPTYVAYRKNSIGTNLLCCAMWIVISKKFKLRLWSAHEEWCDPSRSHRL